MNNPNRSLRLLRLLLNLLSLLLNLLPNPHLLPSLLPLPSPLLLLSLLLLPNLLLLLSLLPLLSLPLLLSPLPLLSPFTLTSAFKVIVCVVFLFHISVCVSRMREIPHGDCALRMYVLAFLFLFDTLNCL